MAITPDTNLYLLKVPIQISNKHQLTFNNKQEQFNYFSNLPKIQAENFSYQRHDNIIRFPEHIDNLLSYNYVIYQNENYSEKWFYAFITNMQYINDGRTDISITTDVWQTWQFDLEFLPSFVEREMVNVSEDIPGNFLQPENFETGEMKIQSTSGFENLEPVYIIAYLGDKLGDQDISQRGYQYNGIWSSITFIVTNSLFVALNQINQAGQGNQIFTVFSIPKLAVQDFVPQDSETESVTYVLPIEQNFKQSPITYGLYSRPNSIDGYTPKNKKLLTYPYCYIACNPVVGSPQIFRFENFSDPENPQVEVISEINPNPAIQIIPKNYLGTSGAAINYSATMQGYPTVSYKTDYYNAWLAQNQETLQIKADYMKQNYYLDLASHSMDMITNLLLPFIGAVAGGSNSTSSSLINTSTSTTGSALNLLSDDNSYEYFVKSQLAQKNQQQLIPDNGNLTQSNSTFLGYNKLSSNLFTLYTIKNEFAKRIDNFWSTYGYLINELKTPNLNNRPNWNYIKTNGINIIADIPQQDLEIIKQLFNTGITLWHNPQTFLNYNQNNR